ncbi:hypothetical protein [Kribbella sp. HUAS MG21]|uniref:Uncharacterized protein n=1 Tax=Kribbella sp. HUAS MG21 TaxID=3160966 RepID=A0AAU7TJ94_9ACTN
MQRRDLDAWATALGVGSDDAAFVQLVRVERMVQGEREDYSAVCDRLRGLDVRGLAALVVDRLDFVQEGLFWVKRDFLLHERGL